MNVLQTRRTFSLEIAVLESLVHCFDKMVQTADNLCDTRGGKEMREKDATRRDVRHWTALRIAGLRGAEKRECRVLASWRSLSKAWK